MTRSQLAHKVACNLRVHLRTTGTLLSADEDRLIWDIVADVANRSPAADAAACRLDSASIAAESQFVRMVRRDDVLEGCLA